MGLVPNCARCGTPLPSAAQVGVCETCGAAVDAPPAIRPTEARDSDSISATVPDWALTGASQADSGRPLFQFKEYEVLSEIARGSMGIVYKARQVRLKRIVAVKVIRSGQIAGSAEIQRFLIEARAAANLQHPNIVAIHEIGEDKGQHFFSMDFVDGPSLAELVRERPLPAHEAVLILKRIAEAIHYAHQRGILHRDLKPSNILMDPHRQPRITDFGVAKLMADDSELTMSGVVLGSPSYMPPEQAEGRTNDVTVRSDIYSVGAILYQLLTGKPPFVGDSPLSTMKLVVECEPTPPRQVNARIPRDLETICLKCLEKNPAKRFGTAQEVAEELDRFLNHQPIRSRSHGPVERTWRWCRRKPAAAAALLIFVCGFIGVLWQWRRAEALAANEATLRHRAEQASVDALLAQARITRSSGVAGQRHRSMEALKTAARLRPSEEVRDEVIACLPLVDLRLWRRWEAGLTPSCRLDIDSLLSRFARSDTNLITVGGLDGKSPALTFPVSGKIPTMVRFSPNGAILGAAFESAFAAWNIESQKLLLWVTNLTGEVVIDLSPDSTRLAAGDGTGGVQVADFASGKLERIGSIDRPCGSIHFDPTGTRLAVSSRESLNLFVFDTIKGEETARLPHPGVLHDVAWHPSGTMVAASCEDHQIYLWRWERNERSILRGHTAPPGQLAFAHSGLLLASLGEDKTLRIWDVPGNRPLVRWEGVSSPILRFAPDDRTLACNVTDATSQVQLLEVTPPAEVHSFANVSPPASVPGAGPAAMLENGHWVILPSDEGLHLWDLSSGVLQEPIRMGGVQRVVLDPDGTNLYVRGFYGVHRFPIARASLRHELLLFGPPYFFDCTPGPGGMALGGKNTLAISEEHAITLADTETGNVRRRLPVQSAVNDISASSDGQWVAASDWESGDVSIWDCQGTNQITLGVHKPSWLSFSPDSRWLATGSPFDCQLWRVDEWKPVLLLRRKRPSPRPSPIAFSRDSKLLAWASADDLVSVTTVADGQSCLSLPASAAGLQSLQFTPEGGGLLIMVRDGTFTLWDLGGVQRKMEDFGLALGVPGPFSHWTTGRTSAPKRVLADVQKIEHTQHARQDLRARETVLRTDPNNFSAWRELAAINSALYRFSTAAEAYDQALRLKPEDVPCAGEDAYVLIKLGREREAAQRFEQVLAQDDKNVNACQQLACLYLHLLAREGNFEAGRRYAERSLQMAPHNAVSLFWRGVAEYRFGRFRAALDLIDQALAADPSSLSFRFYRAMCLCQLGEKTEARETLRLALEALEANPQALVEHRALYQLYIDEAFKVCPPTDTK